MCGIIGYRGKGNASIIAVEGLKELEYRGYDSWGIACKQHESFFVLKKVGKISEYTNYSSLPFSSAAMAHTRWSTHGKVSEQNSHPQLSCDGKIAVVHNGVIENYQKLKQGLSQEGHSFVSETDTEVIPHLIEKFIGLGFEQAVRKAAKMLEGRYAFLAMHSSSENIVAVRNGSPLIVGVQEKNYFVASDINAFIKHTREVIYLEDCEMLVLGSEPNFFSINSGRQVLKKAVKLNIAVQEADAGEYKHLLLKEILEQKQTISKAINQPDKDIKQMSRMINNAQGTFLVGCGTAGRVCFAGQYFFSEIAKKHVNHVVASEFAYFSKFLVPESLMVAVSQSGETADVLVAIEAAKKKHCKIASILNVESSSMARLSDKFFLLNVGPEKAVASTKATTAQLALLLLLSYACAGRLGEGKKLLADVAAKVNGMLNQGFEERIKELARLLSAQENIYIIGRSCNYPIALEAAIKLQEVPYVHAEGFAGGELKHGPIALITQGTPCIVFVANDSVKQDILTNAAEVKARGAFLIGIAPEDSELFDFWVRVPDIGIASPIANIIPVQLLSYHLAILRNCDPDKPRNLAKSVTVK